MRRVNFFSCEVFSGITPKNAKILQNIQAASIKNEKN